MPWIFIVSGAILFKFRLFGVSRSIIDLSRSRYFRNQHLEICLSTNFGDLIPCIKNSLNLG